MSERERERERERELKMVQTVDTASTMTDYNYSCWEVLLLSPGL